MAGVLNNLKNRGVQDVLFFCADGLPGFKKVIHATYPNAQVQRCILHMLRNSFKYVPYKDLKKFASEFKPVYKTSTEEITLSKLEGLKEDWGQNIRLQSAIGK